MRRKHKQAGHDSNWCCESCLVVGAINVLDFADIMIEHTKAEESVESPTIPITIAELASLVLQPPCACGGCDNRLDAQSIANNVIERMASTN